MGVIINPYTWHGNVPSPFPDGSPLAVSPAPGSPLFTPADLPVGFLAAWFDGADESTFVTESPLGSPTAIQTWQDKSGNGWDVSATSAIRRPTLTQLNGLSAVEFSGTTIGLSSGIAIGSPVSISPQLTYADVSAFVVFSKQWTEGGTYNMFVQLSNSSGWTSGWHIGDILNNDYVRVAVNAYSSNTVILLDDTTSPKATGIGQAHLAELLWDESANLIEGYYNGNFKDSNTSEASVVDHTGQLVIGNAWPIASGSYSINGILCEVVICRELVTGNQRQQIEGYLAHKWGFQSLLPGGHKYKTVPP